MSLNNQQTKIGRKVELTSSGLVRELANFMSEGVDSHPDWCESLAVAIVGMMIGKDRYMMNNFGKVRGNLFFLMVGASGLSFKSVPLLKVVRPLLKRLTTSVNEDVLADAGITKEQFDAKKATVNKADSKEKQKDEWKKEKAQLDEIEKSMVDFQTPQAFTSELLTTFLSKFPQGMICGDEYTKMFKGTMKKDYLTDNMEDLSRMYDCDMEKRGTQTRGVEHPENAYVSFTSASTYYLLTLMTDDFFLQGTGNRILWILDEEMQIKNIQEEEGKFFWDANKEIAFENKMKEIVEHLMNIRYLPEGIIMPDMAAGIILDRYRLEMYNEAVNKINKNLLDKDANLVSRLAQNAMKLALVHALGRYAQDERNTYQLQDLIVNEEDANWAVAKTRKHFAYYIRMWELASTIKTGSIKSYLTDQERTIYIAKKVIKRGEKFTARILRQQTGWSKEDCQRLIDTMIANNQLVYRETISGNNKFGYYEVVEQNPSV